MIEVTEKLDAEAKRLRKLSPGDLADEIGVLEARVDALKGEAIRRELHLSRARPTASSWLGLP